MRILAIGPALHGADDQRFGGHERQLVAEAAGDPRRMHLQAVHHVLHDHEDGVGREERLGDGQAAIGAVVERALEELHAVREIGVGLEGQHEPGQRRDAFAAHGVPLVCHGRRPDLLLLERLLDLAIRLQHADVAAELGGAGRHAGHHVEHGGIELARVGLSCHRERRPEADRRGHGPLQTAHLVVVAAEQVEERRLRAGGSLHAAARQGIAAVIELGEIEGEVLHPECGAFAHGGGLRGLEVRGPERGQVAPPAREFAQPPQHVHELAAQQIEAAPHEDEVGVVGHERAGRAEMDELPGRRGHVAECVDVRHHVMTVAPLVGGHGLEIDVVEVGPHLGDRLGGDRHAERLLRLGQGQPEPAPEAVARIRSPQLQHRPRCVAFGQRRGVLIRRGHRISKSVA